LISSELVYIFNEPDHQPEHNFDKLIDEYMPLSI